MLHRRTFRRHRHPVVAAVFGHLGAVAVLTMAVIAVGSLAPAGATGRPDDDRRGRQRNEYRRTDLVSDQPGVAPLQDPHLVNPWGLAAGPTGPLWVANNATDSATIYPGAVKGSPLTIAPLVVSIPGGKPTGQVFNATGAFGLQVGSGHVPAVFLFSSETGNITGWSPALMPNTEAQLVASVPGAIYKGLALASSGDTPYLYAADFHNARIDVFDAAFMPVDRPGAFHDPTLPPGYAPFNVQAIGGRLYVTYALQSDDAVDDVKGAGHGFVSVFTPEGDFVRPLVSRGKLNSPWGLALAPEDFGRFSGALLIGNFGDGRIHAYSPRSGRFLGTLRDEHRLPIAIDGLWGLRFGNGVTGGPTTLLFSAGPDDEAHGLLGTIEAGD